MPMDHPVLHPTTNHRHDLYYHQRQNRFRHRSRTQNPNQRQNMHD